MVYKTQHEALRLADYLDALLDGAMVNYAIDDMEKAADELRRQHIRIAELEAEIAGGVQALSAAPPALPPYPPLPMQFACSGVFAVYSADQMRAYVDADRAARAPADSVAAPAIGDELRDTLVAVSAAIAERDDRAAQKMIGEILAASPTPPAEQQAAQVIIDFSQVGTAGPFPVVNGRVSLPDSTMQDLVRMLRPTYEAEQQAAPNAAPVCVCGEPQAPDTVHRVDGPCYVAAPQQEAQPNYVVSLVVIKETPTGFNTQNKLYAVHAGSAEEAIGKAVAQLPTDFPEHRLHTSCFVQVSNKAPQQEAQEPVAISEAIERMAADRYKVVPSHESVFHRWAVVAGDGAQQLYLGREVECENMARKFAGAFLDGAFVAMQQAAPQQEAQEPATFRCLHEWDGLVRASMPPKYACKHCHNFFDAPPSPAPQQEAQEPVWDGKLSDAMRNALDALYLQCGHETARDISHQVRKECEAIYTSYTTAKRMYQAARDKLEAIEAKQPQPDPFAAPQPAPLSDDVVRDAARYRWLRENWFTMTSNYQRCITFKVGEPRWSDITEEDLDAAIDAVIAAQGGIK